MTDAERIQEALDHGATVLTSPIVFKQSARDMLVAHPNASAWRKKSRILAVQVGYDFEVETDRGIMTGHTGDWLVTNHPDDDPGSDLWTISEERMANTYERADDEVAGDG